MADSKTSLSIGALFKEVLLDSADVSAITRCVYPVYRERATLPYVVYGRDNLVAAYTKGDVHDKVRLRAICAASDYPTSIRLAEAVRAAVDGKGFVSDTDPELPQVSAIALVESSETYEADAFVQTLVFEINC